MKASSLIILSQTLRATTKNFGRCLMTTATSPAGIELIKSFESVSYTPYLCPGGFLTVGYGHKLEKDSKPKIVSKNEAHELLLQDLKVAENSILRNIKVILLQHQFDALASFTFNVGGGALQRSSLRQKINRETFEEAKDEFIKWVYCNNRKSRGLLIRRRIESELFAGNFSTDLTKKYKI